MTFFLISNACESSPIPTVSRLASRCCASSVMQVMGYLVGGEMVATFRDAFKIAPIHVKASKRFLDRLADVTDPETKRKRIGNEFIAVFEEEAGKLGKIPWLAQGTLYPDVIESVSFKGPSAVI